MVYHRITIPNGTKALQHLVTPKLVSVFIPGDQELLDLVFVRSPVSGRNVEVMVKLMYCILIFLLKIFLSTIF